MAFLDHDLVFLDCEMTGGDPERHDIIEIGAVRSRLPDLPMLDELHVKVAPRTTHGNDLTSMRIAGYSPKEWKSAVTIEESLRRFQAFAAGSLLVGWATYNDLLFVRAAATRVGIEGLVGDAYIELQDWAQERLHFADSPGLQRVANQLKIVRDQEHSAIEDALVTYEVFRLLWRHSPDELDLVTPTLDWNSYSELTGPISLSPVDADARRLELARYAVTETSREALLARRSKYHRDRAR
jgi:DNA polymerase-3 subunit epsilon